MSFASVYKSASPSHLTKLRFGHSQTTSSKQMRNFPRLSKIIYTIFGYTNIGNYARAKVFLKAIRKLPLQEFKNILDLGCGQGEYTFMLANALKQANITALDISPQAIETISQTRQAMNIKNVFTSLGKIDNHSKGEHFDFIYSIDVFEHILPGEMPFRESYQRLNSNGIFLVKMPSKIQRTILPARFFKQHEQWLEREHVGQIYKLDDLRLRMIDAGFEVIHASYSDGLTARLAWEIGYLTKKVNPVLQLLFLPLLKAMVLCDNLLSHKSFGNAMMVIGRKR